MGKIKGTGYKSDTQFVKSKYGEEVFAAILATLSAEDQKLLRGPILSHDWYPAEPIDRFRKAVVQHFNDAPMLTLREMGRYSADFGLTGIYRVFISLVSPMTIIKRSNDLWPKYFDSGRVVVTEADKTTVLIKIMEWNDASEYIGALLTGYFGRAIEISGGHSVEVVQLSSVSRGAPYCEWKVSWR